ncbi:MULTISPECIES: hypothetical protein [unclassified Microcoleus]|nr:MULTISPECIES: hypothetical protein [unclassified Microcoleus]
MSFQVGVTTSYSEIQAVDRVNISIVHAETALYVTSSSESEA